MCILTRPHNCFFKSESAHFHARTGGVKNRPQPGKAITQPMKKIIIISTLLISFAIGFCCGNNNSGMRIDNLEKEIDKRNKIIHDRDSVIERLDSIVFRWRILYEPDFIIREV